MKVNRIHENRLANKLLLCSTFRRAVLILTLRHNFKIQAD